jgi:hypothetical protein
VCCSTVAAGEVSTARGKHSHSRCAGHLAYGRFRFIFGVAGRAFERCVVEAVLLWCALCIQGATVLHDGLEQHRRQQRLGVQQAGHLDAEEEGEVTLQVTKEVIREVCSRHAT